MTSGGYLATLLDVLARQSSRPAARRDLANRLVDLLAVTGHRVRGTEGRLWADFDADADPHAANARLFRSIAEAADPLAAARAAPSLIRQRVFRRLEGWWRRQRQRATFRHLPADLHAVAWNDIPPRRRSHSAKDDIRSAIGHLATYERNQVRPGQPFKGDQEAALWGLADIFIDFTGSDGHPLELPHSPGSLFIKFAHAALWPYFGATEVTVDALAGRWRRAKEHARSTSA